MKRFFVGKRCVCLERLWFQKKIGLTYFWRSLRGISIQTAQETAGMTTKPQWEPPRLFEVRSFPTCVLDVFEAVWESLKLIDVEKIRLLVFFANVLSTSVLTSSFSHPKNGILGHLLKHNKQDKTHVDMFLSLF